MTDSLEVRVEGNTFTRTTSYEPGPGETHSEGISPTSLGVKYRFFDGEERQDPSFGAILRIFPVSGSGGAKSSRTTGDLRLAADWEFAPGWSLNPNIGLAVYEDDSQRAYTTGLVAATLGYEVSKVLSIFVDTGVQAPETRHGKASVIVDIGAAYAIGRDVQVDFSLGSGVSGSTSPRLFLAAGISVRF